jgi:hypothetical protein
MRTTLLRTIPVRPSRLLTASIFTTRKVVHRATISITALHLAARAIPLGSACLITVTMLSTRRVHRATVAIATIGFTTRALSIGTPCVLAARLVATRMMHLCLMFFT